MSSIIKIILAMSIWGSIGVFVKNISLESFEIAFLRAIIASIVVGGLHLFNKSKSNESSEIINKKSKYLLILSGILIGFNWVLLFKSYEYTTVSNATLSYYFAPIIVVILSPIFLKEKFTLRIVYSSIAAILGLILIIKFDDSVGLNINYNHIKGILMGLSAAFLYATVMMLNRYIQEYSDYERTFIQLFSAALVLLPFIIFRNNLIINDGKTLILILILGILHTGFAYCIYFSAIKGISSQLTALLSYIDPVSSIILSAIFLGEGFSIYKILGGIIILLSTYMAQKKNKENIELINIEN